MNPAPLQTLYCAYAISSAVCLSGVVCVCVYQFKDSFLVRNRFFTHSKVGLDQKRIYLRKKESLDSRKQVPILLFWCRVSFQINSIFWLYLGLPGVIGASHLFLNLTFQRSFPCEYFF